MAKQDTGSDELPERTGKGQRRADQAHAARIERDSFSVPDRPGRPHGDYGHERD